MVSDDISKQLIYRNLFFDRDLLMQKNGII